MTIFQALKEFRKYVIHEGGHAIVRFGENSVVEVYRGTTDGGFAYFKSYSLDQIAEIIRERKEVENLQDLLDFLRDHLKSARWPSLHERIDAVQSDLDLRVKLAEGGA